MPAPFASPVRREAPQNHADRADNVRDCGNEAGLQVREVAHAFDDKGQEEGDAVRRRDDRHINQGQHQDASITECLHERLRALRRLDRPLLLAEFAFQPFALLRFEPARHCRAIGHNSDHNERERNCWQRLEHKQPLPTGDPKSPVEF